MNRNERTPRTLADCAFTVGYPASRPISPTRVHPSTWFILACGIAGLLITWWTR